MNNDILGFLNPLHQYGHAMDFNEPYWIAMLMLCRLCAINEGAKESVVHYHKPFINLVKMLLTKWGPLCPSKLGDSCCENSKQCCKLFLACFSSVVLTSLGLVL